MLGEVGLDKQYRVAFDYHASPRRLTPFTIPLDRLRALLLCSSVPNRPAYD
jgi:hypothetical protein